jgi:hypothetical protein
LLLKRYRSVFLPCLFAAALAAPQSAHAAVASIPAEPSVLGSEEHVAPDAPPCAVRDIDTNRWLPPDRVPPLKEGDHIRCHVKARPVVIDIQPAPRKP